VRGKGAARLTIRAGLSAGYTEQGYLLAVPSRSGFGPARGPVQNRNSQHSLIGVNAEFL
ncbi:hypothetical protein A2U01_0075959, partial [Trifolium medium]|nr:hypothetical protein [Trifolium medium]